jgi:hypothetical protein
VAEGFACSIFISYRSGDSLFAIDPLYKALTRRLGEDAVFVDRRRLEAPVEWPEEIETNARSCAVMLAVIGSDWQAVASEGDLRKLPLLQNPSDWVRREIQWAMAENRWVIPVLLNEVELPTKQFLEACGLDRLYSTQCSRLRAAEIDLDCERIFDRIKGEIPKTTYGNSVRQTVSFARTPPAAFGRTVVERFRSELMDIAGSVGASISGASWEHADLQFLFDAVVGSQPDTEDRQKAYLVLRILLDALEAKGVLARLGGGDLAYAQLALVADREIPGVPEPPPSVADDLLIHAASVSAASSDAVPPLARYVLAVAALAEQRPLDDPDLCRWLAVGDVQLADAEAHLDRCRQRAWLVIDLGPEPDLGEAVWPVEIRGTVYSMHGEPHRLGPIRCRTRSRDGLGAALSELLERIGGMRAPTVDLRMPAVLLPERIEAWNVVDLGSVRGSLALDHEPRLRWSQRTNTPRLQQMWMAHVDRGDWSHPPAALPGEIAENEADLANWLETHKCHPFVIMGHSELTNAVVGRLKDMLARGCSFICWIDDETEDGHRDEVCRIHAAVPANTRRTVVPSRLRELVARRRVTLFWDDPDGRDGIKLPPRVALQGPED